MTVRKFGRRWMLLGAGGAAIALPALPSLLGGPHRAEAQPGTDPRRMVAIVSGHGGIWQPDMYPDASMADTPFDHPLHRCHRGTLRSRVEGGDRLVSEALRAPSSVFTESIAQKMNVLRGLDVPFYFGHARHSLGSYADMSNNHDNIADDIETADQVMAHSGAVYDSTPRRRLVYFGRHALSVELRDREAGPSAGFRPAEEVGAEAIFDSIYVDVGGEPERAPPIDLVHESYRRLESGAFGAGRRLGRADRDRLSQYMDRLSDIRSSLSSPVGRYCGDVERPGGLSGGGSSYSSRNFDLINNVVMAAFMCDSSRVAVLYMDSFGGSDTPDIESEGGYHEVVHNAASNGDEIGLDGVRRLQSFVMRENRSFFQQGVLDLVSKMDSLDEGDGTLLDNSLVWWTHEAGSTTHLGDSIPIVTFGGAAGAMQTGQYLDLRNRDDDEIGSGRLTDAERRRGACYFQWTTTYLDAFSVPRSEWEADDRTAFSRMPNEPQAGWEIQYDWDDMDASCAESLPLLTR